MANIITGDQGDNSLYGTWDNDILRGLGGDDFLMGGGGNDTFEGGAGNDRIENVGGNNTYLFGRGDGQDTILAHNPNANKHSTIRFGADIAPGDIVAERVENNLVLRIAGTSDSITVTNFFMPSWGNGNPFGIEEVRFFDGASWDRAALLTQIAPLAQLDDSDNFFGGGNVDGKGGNDELMGSWNDDVMYGGDGNDRLLGFDGNDFLIGGAGNDVLDGGFGDNTFRFAPGSGHDTVVLNGMGTPLGTNIEIANTLQGTLDLTRSDNGNGADLIISARGGSDSVTLAGYFDPNSQAAFSVRITFADNSVWDHQRIEQAMMFMPPGENLTGTEGMDVLNGSWSNDRLDGAGGDDVLDGMWGNDVLLGGDGNDQLRGQDGDDLLVGGAGDDFLEGGYGGDVLLGGDGIDNLYGGDGDDILDAGAGDAFVDGGMGNNLIMVGRSAGRVMVAPRPEGSQTIVFSADVRPEDIIVSKEGDWMINIAIRGTEARVSSPMMMGFPDDQGGQSTKVFVQLKFADGTVWDNAILLRQLYTGDDESNDIIGSSGADTMDGRGGNDHLHGNDGNDTIRGGSGNDMLFGGMGDDVLLGQDGFDALIGDMGNDILQGGTGDDFIDGGTGTNIIRYGLHDGVDTVLAGWNRSDTHNIVEFGAGILASDVKVGYEIWSGRLTLTVGTGNDQLIVEQFHIEGQADGLDAVHFADGTVWDSAELMRLVYTGDDANNVIMGSMGADFMDGRGGDDHLHGMGGNDELRGGTGNDALFGVDGDDVLIGGAGDDVLDGGTGNNIFRFERGDGSDLIEANFDRTAPMSNTLEFGAGIVQDEVVVAIDQNTGELSLTVGGAANDVVRVGKYHMDGLSDALTQVRFADGSSWDNAEIGRRALTGNDGHNFLVGGNGDDVIDGKGGDDVLQGKDGNDTLLGGAGNDWLDGGRGNNVFVGGSGNDLMLADGGADTYVFNRGNGVDTIDDTGSGDPAVQNVIRFGPGIAASDMWLEVVGNVLHIHYGAGDEIRVNNFNAGGPDDMLPINRFEFADNSVLTYRQLSNHAPELLTLVPDLEVMEGKPLAYTIAPNTFFDRDLGDVLTLELSTMMGEPLPAWLSFDPLTNQISGTPGYGDSGELWLKVTARDTQGAISNDNFHLMVRNVDPGPELRNAIATQNATEASQFSLVIPGNTFVDPDGGALWYKLALAGDAPLPSWLHFDAASMTLTGTPGDADTGVLTLRLTAVDLAGQVASTEYTLNVANINQAPVLLQAPASQNVEDGVAFSAVLPANMFSDADAGDSGALSVQGLPAGFTFNAQTRTISGMASLAEVGTHALTVQFTDAGGLSASAGFALTVTAAASVTLTGTSGANVLTGKSNSDVLRGLGGDDVLNGGIGADRMEGGSGNDIFYVDNAGDLVVENTAEGTDTVMSAISYTLGSNVERLTLTGSGAINATGNTLNNLITGNSGNNVIDGGLGDDNMAGGLGNDTYMVGSTSDAVTEAAGAGFDRVISSVGRTLGANQEVLTLTGTAPVNGSGNALNNLIQGNGGVNTLSGGDGVDILQGGAGDDILNDTSVQGNLFDGGLGADRLVGGAGNDLFIGGAGNDTITTGAGSDIIAFNRGGGSDSVAVATGTDNTVSLGHGIVFADLALSKTGNDLILKTGMGEQIAFKGWYSSTNAHSVGTLQVVTEGTSDYVAGSSSVIHDNKVEQFNFTALAAKFDQVRAGQSTSFSWSLGSSLEQFSNGGSDTAAIGGDLAYQYALTDSLAALSAMPALAILGSPTFGSGQALQSAAALNDGIAVLY